MKKFILVGFMGIVLFLRAYGFYGVINSDTTWTDTMYVTGDVVVTQNADLNVEPGTVVILGVDNSSWSEWDTTGGSPPSNAPGFFGYADIIVYGSIHSEGTETDSVRFEPAPISYPPGENVVWGGIYIHWDTEDYFKTSTFSHTVISGSYLGISVDAQGVWDTVYIEDSHITDIHPCKGIWVCCCGDSGITAYGILTQNLFDLELINSKIENVSGFFGQCGDNIYGVAGGDGGDAYGVKLMNSISYNIHNIEIDGVYGGKGGDYIFSPSATSGSNPKTSQSSGGGHGGKAYGIFINSYPYQSSFFSNTITHVTGGQGGDDNLGSGGPGGDAIDCYFYNYGENLLVSNNEFLPAQGGEHGNSTGEYALSKSIIIDGLYPPTFSGAIENYNTILGSNFAMVNLTPYEINATYNYWGTNDPSLIDSLIWDCVDDTTVGCVDYVPWVYSQKITEKNSEKIPELSLSSMLVKGNLRIKWSFPPKEKKGNIKLVNAAGRVILRKEVNSQGVMDIDLDKAGLSSGIYFVLLQVGEKTHSVKFVRINMDRH